jgi:hypothetical protein
MHGGVANRVVLTIASGHQKQTKEKKKSQPARGWLFVVWSG